MSVNITALFPCSRWMYWTDWEEDPKESKRGKIERAWMDGSNRNILLTSKTVLWPNGLSLDIPQGILYWVDAYYDRIEMVYLNSTERKVSTYLPSSGLFYCGIEAERCTGIMAGDYFDRVWHVLRELMRNVCFKAVENCVCGPSFVGWSLWVLAFLIRLQQFVVLTGVFAGLTVALWQSFHPLNTNKVFGILYLI